jgi:DNA-binding CsgD family transcriptional regulator
MAESGVFFKTPEALPEDGLEYSADGAVLTGFADTSILGSIEPEDWLRSWGALDGRARLVIDEERTVLAADQNAKAALRAAQGLRLCNRQVEPSDNAYLAAFEEFIGDSRAGMQVFYLPRKDGDGHFILQAVKIAERQAKSVFAVAIRSTDSGFKPRWADLTRVFNLTPAEDHVVKLLLGGLSAEQIAERNCLSIDTIRTHVRHAYDKLYVSSREQLWYRLAPYRLN